MHFLVLPKKPIAQLSASSDEDEQVRMYMCVLWSIPHILRLAIHFHAPPATYPTE